jgi:hypothetical protein
MRATSSHTARRWGLVALIAGGTALVSVFQTSAGHALLVKTGLSRGTTGYTSLSFLHPRSLPAQLKTSHAKVGAPFAIHNATPTTHDYHWSVMLMRHGQTRPVHAGTVRLPAGHTAVVSRSIAITCSQDQVRIVISLERPAESIDAWVRCWSPGS